MRFKLGDLGLILVHISLGLNGTNKVDTHFSHSSPLRGHVPVLDDGVVEVSVEAGLDVGHILHLRDAPHRDLLAPVLVIQWGAHRVPSLI